MIDKKWLQNLEIGDEVIVIDNIHRDQIVSVNRVTKTQIILKSGTKFRKSDGSAVSNSSWNRMFIHKPESDLIDKVLKENLVRYLKRISWDDMSLETLQCVKSRIDPTGIGMEN